MNLPIQQVVVDEPLGERVFAVAELPLSFGGSGAHILLPGLAAGSVAAHLGYHEGRLFLQPAAGACFWRRAGVTLNSAVWLQSGDRLEAMLNGSPPSIVAICRVEADGARLRISVRHEGGANVTAPPVREGGSVEPPPVAHVGERRVRPMPFQVALPTGARPVLPASATGNPLVRRTAWAVGGVVLAALLVFFFGAGAVQVRVAPDAAPDRVDFQETWLDFGIGGNRLVWPGEYTVRIGKEGYIDGITRVTVGRDPQVLRLALEKTPGTLVVDTGGIAGKASFGNGPSMPVPGRILAPAGKQELLIRARKYRDAKIPLEVMGSGSEQAVKVALEPAFAAVTFTSRPAGATVRIDGDELGRTPVTVDVGAGRREAEFLLAGHAPGKVRFNVIAGKPQALGPVQLRLPAATIELVSLPADAQVNVNGQFRGRTPLLLSLDVEQPARLSVSRLGYDTAEKTLTLTPGTRVREKIELRAQIGEISLIGTPADAQLLVDGVERGAANQVLKLPAAPVKLEVRRNGLESFVTTVTPREGFRQEVRFALLSAAEKRAAALPAVRRTAAGQQLRLMPTATYTMGSPRREPGRRSNEAQRVVELRRRYYMGVREVTNAEFRQFRKEHLSGVFKQETLDLDNRPVVNISWADAAEYCNWLSARDGLPPAYVVGGDGKLTLAEPVTTGYRLPTEAEWEFVARWDGTGARYKYPWGSALPVAVRSGNYADVQAAYLTQTVIPEYDDGFRTTAPVGSFAPNALGLQDLGGNAAEWTTDVYQVSPEGQDVAVDPAVRGDIGQYAIRGAHWLTFAPGELRLAWRDNGANPRQTVGFRLARYAE